MLPFPGGIEAISNGLLVFSAIAAFLYLGALKQPLSLKRAGVKSLAVFLLGMIALSQGAATALVVGLLLASFGDFCLSMPGENSFQIGLTGFLGAQLAYVVMFVGMTDADTFLWLSRPWRIALALILIAHTTRFAMILWKRMPNELRPQVIAYAMIITLMCVTALGVAPPLVIIGVALFVLSDTLIGYEKFVWPSGSPNLDWSEPIVWLSYYSAQIFIVLGTLQ